MGTKVTKMASSSSDFSLPSSTIFRIQMPPAEKLVSVTCMLVVLCLIQLRYDYVDGNPIPTVIFNGQSSIFHAFLIFLSLAFSAAISTASLCQVYPKIALSCRYLALASMAAVFGLLMWAVVL